LTSVDAGEEQAQKVCVSGLLGVEQTSRLGLWDPVASVIKCRPHGGKNSQANSCAVSWSSLKTKVKLGRRGGSRTKSVRFPVVHHKTTGLLF
jgi:hypothetical protein